MKAASYIFVFIVGISLCFLIMRGCYGKNDNQSIRDSLNLEIKRGDSIKAKNTLLNAQNDTVIAINQRNVTTYQHQLDSESRVIAVLKGQIKVSKDSIYQSYNDLKKYYDNHDTVALAETYKNLATQLNDANNLLFQVQLARDSSDHLRDDEIVRSHAVIDTLQSEITQFKVVLTDCTNNNAALSKTAQKALKKSKANALLSKIGGGVAALLAVILLVK